MDDIFHISPRQVLPRWRTLASTPGHELESSRRGSRSTIPINRAITIEKAAFERSAGIVEAVELLETAVVSGNYSDATSAAYWVLRNQDRSRLGAVQLAKVVLGITPPLEPLLPPNQTIDSPKLRYAAFQLKRRLVDHPRDAISRTDLARLYLLQGQHKKAADAMSIAAKAAPDNRFVLRSAAQLFATISQEERGLQLLWNSEAVRSDPWVQAAEVALVDAMGRSPRYGHRQRTALMATKDLSVRYSELAAGLASLEWKSGAKRSKVRKLIERSLASPTENSLAQAVWLGAEGDLNLTTEELISNSINAHEAQSRSAYEGGNYRLCAQSALNWFLDQPFSREAARDYLFVSSVHLSDYSQSSMIGEAALRLHPQDFTLLNGMMYASVMANKIGKARDYFDRLRSLKSDSSQQAFIHAGSGLLAFADGNIESGREFYLRAIETARDAKKPTLAINAYIYWLEREAHAGSSTSDEIFANIREIDSVLDKLPKHMSSDSNPTWQSKKQTIIEIVNGKQNLLTGSLRLPGGKKVFYTIPPESLTAAMKHLHLE